MSSNLSPEQVREKHKQALPAETGALYHALYDSLTTAYLSWIIFKDLFAKSEERVALLNRTASTFFLVLSETLKRDVLLAIARITDSAMTGRTQENATIDALVTDLLPHVDEECRKELKQKASDLALICAPVRQRRNKTLAHSDKQVAFGGPKAPVLSGITMGDVDTALEAISGVLNLVSRRFRTRDDVLRGRDSRRRGRVAGPSPTQRPSLSRRYAVREEGLPTQRRDFSRGGTARLEGAHLMGHHFVPQAYLRAFQSPDEPGMIWTYPRNAKPRLAGIKSVAQSSGFYDSDVESDLNTYIEAPANRFWIDSGAMRGSTRSNAFRSLCMSGR